MTDHELYRTSAPYREVVDELHRLQSEVGALRAAYGNAIADQQRTKELFASAIASVADCIQRCQAVLRDDPGRGGSGGSSH